MLKGLTFIPHLSSNLARTGFSLWPVELPACRSDAGGLDGDGRATILGAIKERSSPVIEPWLLRRSARFQRGQDHPFDDRGKARPSVDQPGQVRVDLRFTGQGIGQGKRGAWGNWHVGFLLRRRGCGFNWDFLK